MRAIETSRLRVRRFVEADREAVVRLLDDCFGPAARVEREAWLGWAVRNYDALAALGQPPYGDYAIELRDGGEVVGSVGIVPSFGPFEKLPWFRARLRGGAASGLFTPEVGLFWVVGTAHRGKGYATEAARAVAAYVFETMRADRVVATTEHDNAASIGVMRRIGMSVEVNPDGEPEWFQVVGVLGNPAGGWPSPRYSHL
jgi:[ribosomal protein S5]-alanine N-acetyltransferase